MSFDPTAGGRRETSHDGQARSFAKDGNLMSEHTRLPNLDYQKLAIDRLSRIKTGTQPPTGRYDALVSFLQQRGSQVNAAEVDQRLRTWFEDVISRILQSPAEWDQDRTLSGKVLMDYLSGIKSEEAPQPPQAPVQGSQEQR